MFNKQDQKDIKEIETIVGPSVNIKGDFHGSGNIVVEGSVEGSLKSDKMISIKNKAKVVAEVQAHDAIIGGHVKGNIKIAGYLEVLNSAKIIGDIEAKIISIEKGAVFVGSCQMKSEQEPKDHEKFKPNIEKQVGSEEHKG